MLKSVSARLKFSPSTKDDAKLEDIPKGKSVVPNLTSAIESDDDSEADNISPRALQFGMTQADYEFVRKIMLKYDFSDNGFIEIRECAHLLQDLNRGEPYSKDEVRRIFRESDQDGDSRLNTLEVHNMLEKWYATQEVGRVEEVDYSMLKCAIM